MNASVTATEMLKFVTWVRSPLQAMNSSISGGWTRRVPMLARPRAVHERGRIRHPAPGGHELKERLRQPFHGLLGGPVASIRLGDGARDPPEQVLGSLDRLALVVLHQVAALEHGDGVGAQIECAGAAGSRHAGSSLAEVSLLTKRVVCVKFTARGSKRRGGAR